MNRRRRKSRQEKQGKNENWFVRFARSAAKYVKAKKEFSKEEYSLALNFLGWDLEPREVNAAPVYGMMLSIIIILPLLLLVAANLFLGIPIPLLGIRLPFTIGLYLLLGLVMLPFIVSYYLQNYLLSAAKAEKMKSITYIPEIVNYLVMSMKLSPNLEKALEFAAEHGRGKIADDLKKLVWDTRIGVYHSIEEALDDFAYKWGAFSDEFKHALMLIRSSVIEVDEAKRNALLDKAVTETLEGIKESMNKYAADMRQPSIYLYYLGVLLPLMLIIMLPIGAMMARMPIAKAPILVLLYNVLLPLFAFFFAKNILSKKPPVYEPPVIPDNYPGLPKKGTMRIGKTAVPVIVIAFFLAVLIYFSFAYVLEPLLNPVPPVWEKAAREAYFHFFQLAGAVISIAVFASVMLYGSAADKRKAQKEVMQMEEEFQDSIYIIASRLGENRPMEEAVSYASKFLPKSKTADLFKATYSNIQNLGLTVEKALFDPLYGSLKNVPSDLIRGAMRIVVDSIGLGVQQAARALISLSMQLRDSQKVRESIKASLGEVTSMMKSIAFLIAPLVLGITTALQRIIISALQATAQTQQVGGAVSGVSLPMMSLGDASMLSQVPSPFLFMLIMAVYVIEITVILVYFVTHVEEGRNDLALKINLARSIPIALFFFFLAAWFGSHLTVSM